MMARNIVRKAWRFLTRLTLAATLIAILLAVIALGSCFPQQPDSLAADPQSMADWQAGVRARYGSLADALAAIGLLRWYRSPLFWICLTLLAVTTLVCTLDRWGTIWQRAFRSQAGPSDLAFKTAPHSVRLAALQAAGASNVMQRYLEEHGFRVLSQTTGNALYLRGDRNRMAALGTLVTHVAVLLLLGGVILSSVSGWRQELVIEPYETAGLVYDNQIALRNDGFAIMRYPDGSVAGYEARVAVLEGDQEVARGSIELNRPLTYHGIGFFLRGYMEREAGYGLTLLAVRDPGYGLVIAAGLLLLSGLTISFNFPRCWIQGRFESDGTLHLAGWAERRACDFGREFTTLAGELSRLKEIRPEDAN
ncbi:MAG: hypothetical protein Kow0063_04510 [Anaerolineae bacterium]